MHIINIFPLFCSFYLAINNFSFSTGFVDVRKSPLLFKKTIQSSISKNMVRIANILTPLPVRFINAIKKFKNDKKNNIKNEIPEIPEIPKIKDVIKPIELAPNLQFTWYVIDEVKNIENNILYKKTILNKHYVIWRNSKNEYNAIDNACCHRGASLANGKLMNGNVICPYHGATFNKEGNLLEIPGETKKNFALACYKQNSYPIFEKNGWVYLNTVNKQLFQSQNQNDSLIELYSSQIYDEPESQDNNFRCIYENTLIQSPCRTVSENLLDIMHIAFVHTFGNDRNPVPLNDANPTKVKTEKQTETETEPENDLNHYKILYFYETGKKSLANTLYSVKHIIVENEFILPHTVVSRVKFEENTKTIVTFALPVSDNQTRLFVKLYRNFWHIKPFLCFDKIYNKLGDNIMSKILESTVREDRDILESIETGDENGKFNMKYDKFPYMYRQLYNKLIRK
jgi:phenylpropionate dioxygenase-like ring-hydroxylating dioxygenase large terminal subunit